MPLLLLCLSSTTPHRWFILIKIRTPCNNSSKAQVKIRTNWTFALLSCRSRPTSCLLAKLLVVDGRRPTLDLPSLSHELLLLKQRASADPPSPGQDQLTNLTTGKARDKGGKVKSNFLFVCFFNQRCLSCLILNYVRNWRLPRVKGSIYEYWPSIAFHLI